MEDVKNLWIYQTYNVFMTYDTGIKVDYVLLMLLMFGMAIIIGRRLQYVNEKYWKTIWPFILIFTLVEGLRYLRGVDYLNYALLYKFHGDPSSLTELIYLFAQQTFHFFNVPFWFPFLFYSFVWCFGFSYLLKDYRQYAKYILPLFVMFSLGTFETFIRQSFAWGLVFMFLSELLKENYKKSILFAACSVLIHNGSFVFILIILCVRLIKKPVNLYVIIFLYLFGMIAFDISNLGYISNIISKIPYLGDTVFGNYIADADRWFSADAVREKYERGVITKIGVMFLDLSVFVLGYMKLKGEQSSPQYRNNLLVYNLFCLTTALLQFVFTVEIPKRVLSVFYGFAAFILAWVYMDVYLRKKYKLWFNLLSLYLVVYYFKQILFAQNQLFVWDNAGPYYFNL